MKPTLHSMRPVSAAALAIALGALAACTSPPAAPEAALTAPAAPAADTAFTIAVIPDTQNYLDFTHQTAEGFPFDASELFLEQMAYIAENLESEGGEIAFVTSLGDVCSTRAWKWTPSTPPAASARCPIRFSTRILRPPKK